MPQRVFSFEEAAISRERTQRASVGRSYARKEMFVETPRWMSLRSPKGNKHARGRKNREAPIDVGGRYSVGRIDT
jgi:hypothetical protein